MTLRARLTTTAAVTFTAAALLSGVAPAAHAAPAPAAVAAPGAHASAQAPTRASWGQTHTVQFTAAETAALAKLPNCANVWSVIGPRLPVPLTTSPWAGSSLCRVPEYARSAVAMGKKLGLVINVQIGYPSRVTVSPFYW